MQARRLTAIVLALVGALAAVLGIVLLVADNSLFNEERVEKTTEKIVTDRDIGRLLIREITDRIVAIGDLETDRDNVEAVVTLVVSDERVQDEAVDAVLTSYDMLVNGQDDVIVFNMEDLARDVRRQVVAIDPSLDAQLPGDDEFLRFELLQRTEVPEALDVIHTARRGAWLLLVGGVTCIVAAVVLGPGRFGIFGLAAAVVVAAMFLTATLISTASNNAIDDIPDSLSRRVARLATDEYLSTLDHVAIAVVIFGLIAVIVGIGGSWIKNALWPPKIQTVKPK